MMKSSVVRTLMVCLVLSAFSFTTVLHAETQPPTPTATLIQPYETQPPTP